jgi:hypothetical protein
MPKHRVNENLDRQRCRSLTLSTEANFALICGKLDDAAYIESHAHRNTLLVNQQMGFAKVKQTLEDIFVVGTPNS